MLVPQCNELELQANNRKTDQNVWAITMPQISYSHMYFQAVPLHYSLYKCCKICKITVTVLLLDLLFEVSCFILNTAQEV